MVFSKESSMTKLVYENFKKSIRDQSYDISLYWKLCVPFFWFCGMFIYGFVASNCYGFYCGFNASFGNAFRLSNVGFDGPPTVYTVGLVTVRDIVYYIKWPTFIRQ